MKTQLKEAQIEVGKWYDFSEFNLPCEKYYVCDEPAQYMYLFAQKDGSETYYYAESTLYCSTDTFKKMENTYWMAVNKL